MQEDDGNYLWCGNAYALIHALCFCGNENYTVTFEGEKLCLSDECITDYEGKVQAYVFLPQGRLRAELFFAGNGHCKNGVIGKEPAFFKNKCLVTDPYDSSVPCERNATTIECSEPNSHFLHCRGTSVWASECQE